jgi:hypothetical protein
MLGKMTRKMTALWQPRGCDNIHWSNSVESKLVEARPGQG